MSVISEVRNGFNNSVRRVAQHALDVVRPPALVKYPTSLAVDLLTTPIHLGRNASDTDKAGKNHWNARSLVIGTKSAKASNGTALAIGNAKAGKDSNAISVRGKADSGKGGTSVSISAKGVSSAGEKGQVYKSSFDVNRRNVGKNVDTAA